MTEITAPTPPLLKEAGDACSYFSANEDDITRLLHASALAFLGPGRVYELREREYVAGRGVPRGRAWYWCERFDAEPELSARPEPGTKDGYTLIGRYVTSPELAQGRV